MDVGNVETALESLGASSYYLLVDGTKYRFSISPNLNKLLADRRANIGDARIEERIRSEIQKVITPTVGVERISFPKKSIDIPDRGVLTFVVLPPEQCMEDQETLVRDIKRWTCEYGTGVRRFKSALVWVAAESPSTLRNDARKLLAWEEVKSESVNLRLDEFQQRQLDENLKKAQRDLKESVWRSYKYLLYLGKDGMVQQVDLGLVTSSAAESLMNHYVYRMRQMGDIENEISPNFLVRNWPPALVEWPTKSVKEVFFASPEFPRLLKPDAIGQTLAKGITDGQFAYVGKPSQGKYDPFLFGVSVSSSDIEITDDMYIIRKETAEAYQQSLLIPKTVDLQLPPVADDSSKEKTCDGSVLPLEGTEKEIRQEPKEELVRHLTWSGDIPHQQWMIFYTKVLTPFIPDNDIKLTVRFEISSENGISEQKIEETEKALREMELSDNTVRDTVHR